LVSADILLHLLLFLIRCHIILLLNLLPLYTWPGVLLLLLKEVLQLLLCR
jgi:hypothetical protein